MGKLYRAVYDNHKRDYEHGELEDILDINSGQSTPFYSGVAGNELSIGIPPTPYRFFVDVPYRIDPVESHFWNAELYLAEETTVPGSQKRTVTIYNGIEWGWNNDSRRKTSSGGGESCQADSGGGGCITTAAVSANAVGKEMSRSESPISVPESTSALGVLTLAAWAFLKTLKIRKDKQS